MSSVQVAIFFWQLVVPWLKILQTFLIQSTNWLRQISVNIWVLQVEDWRFIVLQNPRINRVLGKILSAALRVSIKDCKIVEIAHFALDPLLGVLWDGRYFCLAFGWQIVADSVVHAVAIYLVMESDVTSSQGRVWFLLQLQANLH